jgi:hypothetical protein
MRLRTATAKRAAYAPDWDADPEPRLTLTALKAARREHLKASDSGSDSESEGRWLR